MDYVIVSAAIKLMTYYQDFELLCYILKTKKTIAHHSILHIYCTHNISNVLFEDEKQNVSSPFSNPLLWWWYALKINLCRILYELWRWNYFESSYTMYRTPNTIQHNSYWILISNGTCNSLSPNEIPSDFPKYRFWLMGNVSDTCKMWWPGA